MDGSRKDRPRGAAGSDDLGTSLLDDGDKGSLDPSVVVNDRLGILACTNTTPVIAARLERMKEMGR